LADAAIAGVVAYVLCYLDSLVPDELLGAFYTRGYTETSLLDNTTESIKFGWLHLLLLNDSYELVCSV